jgi:hypothetical protein
MKRYGQPETIVTDKLGSYRAALRTIGNAERQETGRWLNNRAENSHQPLRRRERAMQRFRQMRTLQKFAAIHSSVRNHFNQGHKTCHDGVGSSSAQGDSDHIGAKLKPSLDANHHNLGAYAAVAGTTLAAVYAVTIASNRAGAHPQPIAAVSPMDGVTARA